MRNEASKTRTLDIAFVVNAELLRRLAEILGETSHELEYTAKFSNGTSVRYDDIEEVIGQPNSDQRSIVSVIAGTGDEKSKSAYVVLKRTDSPSVEYTINGSQRDVIYFADQLDDWVGAIREWYSPFFSSPSGVSGAGTILLFVVVMLPLYAWEHLSRFSGSLGKGGSYQWVALPILLAMWVTEYYVLQLFPRGTFAIGRGEKNHRFVVYFRNTVLVGLILSVVGGILANWITNHV
jgi:hypothetical protein